MEASKVIKTGYIPRKVLEVIHTNKKRFTVIVAHRRIGKTVLSLNDMIDEALRCLLFNPHYAFISPNYGMSKRSAWEYLKLYTREIPFVEHHEGELKCLIPRPVGMIKYDSNGNKTTLADSITIWLLGSENPDSLRGMYLDGAIFDEVADQSPVVWTSVVRPLLSDRYDLSLKVNKKYGEGTVRESGFAIFIGTPKGTNFFYDLYQHAKSGVEGWTSFMFKASETGLISPAEIADMSKTMTEEEVAQELECAFTGILVGAFFSKYLDEAEKAGRITEVPHDPSQPVAAFFDLGISDSCSVWFVQRQGRRYNVIEAQEFQGMGMEQISKVLFNKPYNYSRFVFPHDAKQRELSTGRTRVEIFEQLGMRPSKIVPRCKQKMEMISAGRLLIPQCWFDRTKCADGLYALRAYQRDYDPKKEDWKQEPLHNWASHYSDSWGYFATGVGEDCFQRGQDLLKNLPIKAETDYNELMY